MPRHPQYQHKWLVKKHRQMVRRFTTLVVKIVGKRVPRKGFQSSQQFQVWHWPQLLQPIGMFSFLGCNMIIHHTYVDSYPIITMKGAPVWSLNHLPDPIEVQVPYFFSGQYRVKIENNIWHMIAKINTVVNNIIHQLIIHQDTIESLHTLIEWYIGYSMYFFLRTLT